MKTAILFIHGFMGSHRQFRGLRKALEGAGADMFAPSLAGHEAALEDFRASGWSQWQEGVDSKLRELRESYDGILLVGHSMGGLLAVRAAVAAPEKVLGVVGIGFPIKVSVGPRWMKLNMAAAAPPTPGEDPRITAARTMAGVPIKSVGQYLSTLPQNMSFLKVAKLAQREITRLKVPLTVINFEKDEIVSPAVPEFVRSRLPEAEVVLLPDSYHFLFQERELEKMAELIRQKAGL